MVKVLVIAEILVLLSGRSYAGKDSRYQSLLVPLDLYSIPRDRDQALDRTALFGRIAQRGLPIRLARENYKLASEDFRLAYDSLSIPRSTVSATYGYTQSASSAISTRTRAYTFGLGLEGDLGWGLQYNLDLPSITTSHAEAGAAPSELATAALGAGVTLKLLKGSWFFLERTIKNQADITYDLARASMRQTVLQAVLSGETTFYDCLLKQARVKVLEQALQNAKALLEDVRDLVRAGEAGRLATIQVDLQIAQTETDLLAAEAELQSARQSLRDIIALNPDEAIDFFPDPSVIKSAPPPPELNVNAALERAKTHRPDYQTALMNKRLAELNEQQALSNALPTLNLTSRYGYGDTQPRLSEALAKTFGFRTPVYAIGLQFSYSLFNDADKTNYRKARISAHRTELSLVQLQNQIAKEVNSSIQNVGLGYRRLKTSELARTLAEQKLAAEFVRFKVGESNIRNVIDFQAEVNNARIAEVASRVFLFTQLSVFRNALGELPSEVVLEN